MLCGECIQKKPPFQRTHALFLYEPPIPKLILDLKFHHQFAHAKLLGELLAKKIQEKWYQTDELPTAIIPIPLHPKRLQERGFNQALEIARPIARRLNLPLFIHDLKRHKATLAQAQLPANLRRQNILQAFSTKKLFNNEHIAVVDDVITTGNTMREFCRLLKKQGAGKISVWCCARPARVTADVPAVSILQPGGERISKQLLRIKNIKLYVGCKQRRRQLTHCKTIDAHQPR